MLLREKTKQCLMAIFGDTSDENNTDSEQLFKDLGNGASTGQPDERQTAILDSEDDSEEVLLESQDLFGWFTSNHYRHKCCNP
ncbi:hypothetical protein ANCCAN_25262 [Ancylostoma caninum]|uniref:Uncharacterized protein n=1 Tax=Ancylostoma caninum TaxID=29170 RepID=A0A368FDB2_ANCCA|nr:hypothetical protein ANCCAN_25262 [Ancylostoma caninum]